jgi:peptide/nickel transport system substrate-binding protein
MTRRSSIVGLAVAAATVVLVASAAAAPMRSLGAQSQAKPFAAAWAQIPRTTAARRASSTIVFGEEQDINGFNTFLSCCNQLAAGFLGANEAIRGAFLQNNKGAFLPDVVTKAVATSKGLTYWIRPDASWYWGGKKLPVTWKDFQYTLQQVDNPSNDIISRSGYANLDPAKTTHKGLKQVSFYWRTKGCSETFPCTTFAAWKTLFSGIFPAAALQGQDFNKIWFDCICGSDGKPVADGPFYVDSYTKGQGSVLKRNPFWWGGKKGTIQTVVMKIITDTNTEVQAMRGGEVDAIAPTFGLNLLPLKGATGLVWQQLPGYFLEHLEFNEGKGASNPLLRAPWMREAIALAIDRQSLIKTVYGQLAGTLGPQNSLVYYSTQPTYKGDFSKWNYNPAKAIALLKAHCSGGPSSPSTSNSAIWTCSGFPARFRWSWTATNQTRTTSEQVMGAWLKAVGIDLTPYPRPADVIFGPNGIPGGDFDIAEFAEVTSGNPSDYYDFWRCGGPANYQSYCSRKASKLMELGEKVIDPKQAAGYWNSADRYFASNVAAFPLYQRPVPLIYKQGIAGMVDNPGTSGPFWNIEDWRWTS